MRHSTKESSMKSNVRKSLLGIGLCVASWGAAAQHAYNVKLAAGNEALRAALWQKAVQPAQSLASLAKVSLKSAMDVQRVLPLGAAERGALADVFTLEFATENPQRLEELRLSGKFAFVEPVRRVQLDALVTAQPNDDSLAKQWYHPYIRTFQAWDYTRGGGIRVGVIDTGLDFGHPEFAGQIAIRVAEDINGNGQLDAWRSDTAIGGVFGDFDGIDNDNNGYVDDVAGYDFTDQPRTPAGGDYLSPDPNPADDNGHGTVVAGIIAAKADNHYGGTGVAPDCKIVVLRAFSQSGAGEDDDISRAIVYAVNNGIKILNFSFGDIYPSLMMHEAIRYAYANGVTMVSSAGNRYGDNAHYPSDFGEVISVSATAANLQTGNESLYPFSMYGYATDLAAPGSGIFAPMLRDTAENGEVKAFIRTQGTSTSAPMVTAAVALLFAHRAAPLLPDQVRGILTTSADDVLDEGWDHYTGAGRLNIERMLKTVGSSIVKIHSPETDAGVAAEVLPVIGTVLDPEFSSYSLEYRRSTEDLGTWKNIVSEVKKQVKDSLLYEWNIASLPDGDYTLRLRVNRTNGFTNEFRVRVVIDRTPPKISILANGEAYDNADRKHLIVFRDEDQGRHTLFFRQKNAPQWQQMMFDRRTRNGEFLLSLTETGVYEGFIRAENLVGNAASSDTFSWSFAPDVLSDFAFLQKNDSLPMGRMLPDAYDFDGDGNREVLMSRFTDNLGYGKLMCYERVGGKFVPMDSLAFKPVLIPKGVADTDGDGLLEILCSANDSTFLVEQPAINSFPRTIIYQDFTKQYYSSQFADTRGDGSTQLIMRQTNASMGKAQPYIYDVWQRQNGEMAKVASLPDRTPYEDLGGVTSRILCEDFDGDGWQETIFGDYDGDLNAYEWNGSGYDFIWQDSTSMLHSADYLCQGDFNGNGKPEFFVMTQSSFKQNADTEYDAARLWLRVFEADADNSYRIVWQTQLYDLDSEDLNATTAGNLDADAQPEIVVTTYPRSYVLDYVSGEYRLTWFTYGALATSHAIGDWNKNGTNEFLLGNGGEAISHEWRSTYSGPTPVSELNGIVLNEQRVRLSWAATAGASKYLIYRTPVPSSQIFLIDSTAQTSFTDKGLDSAKYYLYSIVAKNPTLPTPVAPILTDDGVYLRNGVLLHPHENNIVKTISVISDRQLSVSFSENMTDREDDKPLIRLNDTLSPQAIIGQGRSVMLAFSQPFAEGENTLVLDTLWLDAEKGILSPDYRTNTFTYSPAIQQSLYLTGWEILGEKTALLRFNQPIDATTLTSLPFKIYPAGKIVTAEILPSQPNALRISVADVQLGSLGYSVSVQVLGGLSSLSGASVVAGEGDVATFSGYQEDLSKVYSYPNPARKMTSVNGSGVITFANLTQKCSIEVMTMSGNLVAKMEETDGNGGYTWDMRTLQGERISAGVYFYSITNEAGLSFVGCFSVID